MATSADYLAFVLEQLPPLWDVRSRKMFGEYMVYLNETGAAARRGRHAAVEAEKEEMNEQQQRTACAVLCCCTDCLAGAFVYAGDIYQRGVQGRAQKRRLLRVLFAREKGGVCEQ